MTTRHRRPLVGGNWKMHLVGSDVGDYCDALLPRIEGAAAEVVLFPSAPLLSLVSRALSSSALSPSPIATGGQDLHPADQGAHTGDTSGAQLRDAGCSWVLCGHSERRQDHHESDELVGDKAAAAERHGLRPLICVGETGNDRQAGRTFEVLERQLSGAIRHRPAQMALAYEPVWAIGTGETATPEIAQEAHAFLRQVLADLIGSEAAGVVRILYGGSVNPGNASILAEQPDLDGFLVGGASLEPEKFAPIVAAWE